ncbi:hypothetical protein HPB47_005022 [Ixodes persulcatus]|uniref:Uncharacterized protein n=1 Tax=Ixodes persulcatus TaxID=34615 RepID=A0AC60PE82_IXOPE|nr:hypothetical protein HPB47_005022 [Ixodes persulcatus]
MKLLLPLLWCFFVPMGVHSIHFRRKTARLQQQHAAAINSVVESINSLGIRLLQTVGDRNMLLSPLSVSVVLNMVLLGARGRTAYQMSSQLNHPDKKGLSELLKDMTSTGGNKRATSLDIASAMLIEQGAPYNESYHREIEDLFDANLGVTQFAQNPDEIVKEVNAWANHKTRGRIDKFCSRHLTRQRRCLATGKLSSTPSSQEMRTFHNLDGTKSRVPMMFLIHGFELGYDAALDVDVLKLPYADDHFSMILLVPRNRQNSIGAVVQGLSTSKLNSMLRNLDTQNVELTMPKLNVHQLLKLRGSLEQLGLKVPFSESANFSGISEKLDLRLNEVMHKAALDVDEEGTRAVAATQAQFVSKSLVQFTQFTVDHPFLAFIRHEKSGAVVFLAHIVSMDA